MNVDLRRILDRVRPRLATDPDGVLAGELPPGNSAVDVPSGPLKEYYQFLRECDGCTCGSIDLWSFSELAANQYQAQEFPGGEKRWLCIGQVLYEPLALNKVDGSVWLFRQGPPPDTEGRRLGTFDEFIGRYLFGSGYAEMIPDVEDEEWWQLLHSLQVIA